MKEYTIPNVNVEHFAKTMSNILPAYNNISLFSQQFQEAFRAFHTIFDPFNVQYFKICKLYDVSSQSAYVFTAIEKLSEASYVYWNKFPIDFAKKLSYSDDTDKVLEDYEIQTGGENTKEIFTICLNFLSVEKHKTLLTQTFAAYSHQQYDLAILGLFVVIDWALAKIVTEIEYNKVRLQERYQKLLEKLKKEKLSNEEYSIITFIKTFASAEKTFVASSNFSEIEPNYPNRHWTMHGRSTRLNTKLDYIKTLRFLGGIVKIDELRKS